MIKELEVFSTAIDRALQSGGQPFTLKAAGDDLSGAKPGDRFMLIDGGYPHEASKGRTFEVEILSIDGPFFLGERRFLVRSWPPQLTSQETKR